MRRCRDARVAHWPWGRWESYRKCWYDTTQGRNVDTVDCSEIPKNHLGFTKPCKSWEKLPTSTGKRRISEASTVWQGHFLLQIAVIFLFSVLKSDCRMLTPCPVMPHRPLALSWMVGRPNEVTSLDPSQVTGFRRVTSLREHHEKLSSMYFTYHDWPEKSFFQCQDMAPIKTSLRSYPPRCSRQLGRCVLFRFWNSLDTWRVPGHGGDGAALFAAPDLLEASDVNSSCVTSTRFQQPKISGVHRSFNINLFWKHSLMMLTWLRFWLVSSISSMFFMFISGKSSMGFVLLWWQEVSKLEKSPDLPSDQLGWPNDFWIDRRFPVLYLSQKKANHLEFVLWIFISISQGVILLENWRT